MRPTSFAPGGHGLSLRVRYGRRKKLVHRNRVAQREVHQQSRCSVVSRDYMAPCRDRQRHSLLFIRRTPNRPDQNLKPTSDFFASHVAELYKQHLGDNHRALWGRRWRGWRCRGHGRAGEKKAQPIKPSGTANAWLARAALAGVDLKSPPPDRQKTVCVTLLAQ